jgi:hypothetical protein
MNQDKSLFTHIAINKRFAYGIPEKSPSPETCVCLEVHGEARRERIRSPIRSPRVSSLSPAAGGMAKVSRDEGSLAVVAVKDAFIGAHERSAEGYAAVRQSLGDPFRQRHREALRQLS